MVVEIELWKILIFCLSDIPNVCLESSVPPPSYDKAMEIPSSASLYGGNAGRHETIPISEYRILPAKNTQDFSTPQEK